MPPHTEVATKWGYSAINFYNLAIWIRCSDPDRVLISIHRNRFLSLCSFFFIGKPEIMTSYFMNVKRKLSLVSPTGERF